MGEENDGLPGGTSSARAPFLQEEELDAGVEGAYGAEGIPTMQKEHTPEQLERAIRDRNQDILVGLDDFLKRAQDMADEVTSPTGKHSNKTVTQRMSLASEQSDQALIGELGQYMAAKKTSLRRALAQKLENEDKQKPWYVKAYRAVRGAKKDYGALANHELAKMSDPQILEVSIQEIAAISQGQVGKLEGQMGALDGRSKKARDLRNQVLAKRNVTYDTLYEAKVKLKALEKYISDNARLRDQYIAESAKPDYDGRHDTILDDVKTRISENEPRKAKLEETVRSLKLAVHQLKLDYKRTNARATTTDGYSIMVKGACMEERAKIDMLQDLVTGDGEVEPVVSTLELIAQMRGSPATVIIKNRDELSAQLLGYLGEEMGNGPAAGYQSATSLGQVQQLQKAYLERVEESVAEVAADRFPTSTDL